MEQDNKYCIKTGITAGICNMLNLSEVCESVKRFKKHIEVWNFLCNCRLCKSFAVKLGYI